MQKLNSMMFIKDLGNYEFYSYAFGQRNHIELLKRVYVLFSRVFQKVLFRVSILAIRTTSEQD